MGRIVLIDCKNQYLKGNIKYFLVWPLKVYILNRFLMFEFEITTTISLAKRLFCVVIKYLAS